MRRPVFLLLLILLQITLPVKLSGQKPDYRLFDNISLGTEASVINCFLQDTQRARRALFPAALAIPAAVVSAGGACLLCRPPAPAFSLPSCPLSPRPPSPVGKGERL